MSFGELEIKSSYDSDDDDILNDFYNPVLANSVEYCRLAGFFSSSSLAVAARGIQGLLKNNGEMKLVVGAVLSREDVDAIKEGLENPEKVIERAAIRDLESIEDEFVKNQVMALGWLVATQKLEIRIAVVEDERGFPLDAETILRRGIFHQKVGIFTDTEGRNLSFSGSVNETARAWSENVEEFKVFREWVEAEREHFLSDYKKFQRYWNGESKRVRILEAPQAIKERLIQMAPDNITTLKLEWKPREKITKIISPEDTQIDIQSYKFKDSINQDIDRFRDYQQEAVDKWRQNNCRGILEMATASGKTFIAIMGSYNLYTKTGKLLTTVLVPSKQLVKQWGKELSKYTNNIIKVSSDEKGWEKIIDDFVYLFNQGDTDHLYIVSTIQSYINKVENLLSTIPDKHRLIIADEAHWLGAFETRKNFKSKNPIYSLGLTATPIRYFDEEGTEFLYTFLGDTVYSFSIKDAQDRGFLSKYNYHVKFCDLNRDELQEYIRLTKAIAINYGRRDEEKMTILLNKRAKIIKDANSKFEEFDKLLSELGDEVKYSIVYCDENQLDLVCDILRKHDIIFNTFLKATSDEERQTLLSKLMSGAIDSIVAIRCLNEGVDIPPLKLGFFLSCSANPREFIQRRGRLLRTYEGKGMVNMYDFVVSPDPKQLNLKESERKIHNKILKKELDRIKEFNDTALNSAVTEKIVLEKYNMLL